MGKRWMPGNIRGDQRGNVLILVAVSLLALVGFTAMAIDISHLFVVRNELKNAADAGSLAGARFLYNDEGTAVNADANQIARDAAIANMSEKTAVEVNWSEGNTGDVERGHWSFATRTFIPNASTAAVNLWDVTTAALDSNPDFINAIRVTTRRETVPAASFFARAFGFESFFLNAVSVAYIGFAGTLAPHAVDQPIAVCLESLRINNTFTCSVGRMFTASPTDCATQNSATWTDLTQENACEGGNSLGVPEMRGLIVGGSGNTAMLTLGDGLNTNGGVQNATYMTFRDRWIAETGRTTPWKMTLPVIECAQTHQNLNDCGPLKGAVELQVLWASRWGTGGVSQADYDDFPIYFTNVPGYADWSNNDPDGHNRWIDFAHHFNLVDLCGNPITDILQKSIYFLPVCTPHIPEGQTGGQNFGILARIPVLVQ